MNNIIQVLKKVGLFLFGILLIIWGYKVNAANIEEKAKEEKENNNKEIEQQPVNVPSINDNPTKADSLKVEPKEVVPPKSTNNKKAAPQPKPKTPAETSKTPVPLVEKKAESKPAEEPVKVEEKQTVIEKATPEESSGTE